MAGPKKFNYLYFISKMEDDSNKSLIKLRFTNARLRKALRKLKQAQNLDRNRRSGKTFFQSASPKKVSKSYFQNFKCDAIFDDIVDNRYKPKSKRKYSTFSKLFALGIYERSPEAYNWVRNDIPLPIETTLRKYFSKKIDARKSELTSIDLIHKIINLQQSNIICEQIIDDQEVEDQNFTRNNQSDCGNNNQNSTSNNSQFKTPRRCSPRLKERNKSCECNFQMSTDDSHLNLSSPNNNGQNNSPQRCSPRLKEKKQNKVN